MTERDFCYWLRGVFEIQMAGLTTNDEYLPSLTSAQVDMIRKHLDSVFEPKIDQYSFPQQQVMPGDLQRTIITC